MKAIRFLAVAALGAVLLAGCNKDEGLPAADDRMPVQLTAAIAHALPAKASGKTRASGTAFVATDAIGLFMLTAGRTGIAGNIAEEADNVKYTTNGTAWTPATPIYYPQSGAVDFVAYHPFRKSLVSEPYVYKVDVATQTSPAAIDLLYSNQTKNKSRSTAAVRLEFRHALSKVVLNLKASTGLTDAEVAAVGVTLTGMPTTAAFALSDGTFSELSGTSTGIEPVKWETPNSDYAATLEAIVIPQAENVWSDRAMVFTLASGETFRYALPDTDGFAGGSSYPYTVTVSRTGVTVSKGQIADWTGTGSSEDFGEVLPHKIVKNGIVMHLIPAGTFLMGSPASDALAYADEKPQHYVKLTQDFYMSKYQITNAQYAAFLNAAKVGSNGRFTAADYPGGQYPNTELVQDCSTKTGYEWGVTWATNEWIPMTGYDNHPAIFVTWYGASEYAKWMGGSLPTEAQWEYACRAGTTTAYSYGDEASGDYMWYQDNNTTNGETSGTKAVGRKQPNPWGLYDMHGNVLEWCRDSWDSSIKYPTASTEAAAVPDPVGTAGADRVLRGGSWGSGAQGCRSAFRGYTNPGNAGSNVGFRVVFVP